MFNVALKSITLVVSVYIFHRGINPPTPPPAKEHVVYKGQLFEYMSRSLIYWWQVSFASPVVHCPQTYRDAQFLAFATVVCHIAAMALLQDPSLDKSAKVLPVICHNPAPSLATLSSFPPGFFAGLALMLGAGLLRVWCYRTMGRMFTFEVAIKNDHKLITDGPYAYARHPAYTGGIMMLFGTYFMGFGPDSFVSVCNVTATRGLWLVWSWRIPAVYGGFALLRRTGVEDGKLKEKFGKTWEEYRQRVPYKYIPYVA